MRLLWLAHAICVLLAPERKENRNGMDTDFLIQFDSIHKLSTGLYSNLIRLNMLSVIYTHPRHEFHKDGQFSLHRITQASVVLHYALVTQVLQ